MSGEGTYGATARVGVVTPQANPTVEPELSVLLPAGVSMLAARAVSRGDAPQRLRDYLVQLEDTLQRFDTLPLDAVAFGCTGSAYVVGHDSEQRTLDGLEQRFGYPVVSAAQAIDAALRFLGAERIALACPYPEWLLNAATDYWTARGYQLLASGSAQADSGDTRAIYALAPAAAEPSIRRLFAAADDADALVITGTGMPSLDLVSRLTRELQKPVLSSNLCLAWETLRRAGIEAGDRAADAQFPLLSGWQTALQRL